MSNHMPEKPTPKYAWIALLVVSLASLAIGIGDYLLAGDGDPALAETMTGMPWEEMKEVTPRVVNLTNLLSRVLGAWLISFSILGIGLTLVPYRRGERWAWYVLWSMPFAYLLVFVAFITAERVPSTPTPPALFSAPGLFAISTLALLLPVRTFFAKSDSGPLGGAAMPTDDDHATD